MQTVASENELTSDNWMVAWDPDGNVLVGPWPDRTGWSSPLQRTTGCCNMRWHRATDVEKTAIMFAEFHAMIVRDGVDPRAAHRQFLKIPLYRRAIAPDIDGAEGEGGWL
jgi:hypothetical protein